MSESTETPVATPNPLYVALAAIQQTVESVTKDSTNPHFKSNYASIETVLDLLLPLYRTHGLLLIQAPTEPKQHGGTFTIGLITTIIHVASGNSVSSTAIAPLQKDDPQGVGSAITYLRRYSLVAFHGLRQEDDDGNAASGTKGKLDREPKAAPPKPQQVAEALGAGNQTERPARQQRKPEEQAAAETPQNKPTGKLWGGRK